MMYLTHMLFSSIATSMVLETANPVILMVGAAAGILPEIDLCVPKQVQVSANHSSEQNSDEYRCTYSLVGSCFVSVIVYGVTYHLDHKFVFLADAINTGYFFGWFINIFGKTGVPMFWPNPIRCVCPGNQKYRIQSGSRNEYILLVVLVVVAFLSFNFYSLDEFVSKRL